MKIQGIFLLGFCVGLFFDIYFLQTYGILNGESFMFSSLGGEVWMDMVMHVGVVTACVATTSLQQGKIQHIIDVPLLKVRCNMQLLILYGQV